MTKYFLALLTLVIATGCSTTSSESADETNRDPNRPGRIVIGKNPNWIEPRLVWKLGNLDGCTFYEVDGMYEHILMHCRDGHESESNYRMTGGKNQSPVYDETTK